MCKQVFFQEVVLLNMPLFREKNIVLLYITFILELLFNVVKLKVLKDFLIEFNVNLEDNEW